MNNRNNTPSMIGAELVKKLRDTRLAMPVVTQQEDY